MQAVATKLIDVTENNADKIAASMVCRCKEKPQNPFLSQSFRRQGDSPGR